MSPHPTAMGYGKILTFSCGTDLAITLRLIQPSCFPSVDRMAHKTENKKTDVARSNTAAVSPSLFWSPESKQNHCTIANARFTLPAAPVEEPGYASGSFLPKHTPFARHGQTLMSELDSQHTRFPTPCRWALGFPPYAAPAPTAHLSRGSAQPCAAPFNSSQTSSVPCWALTNFAVASLARSFASSWEVCNSSSHHRFDFLLFKSQYSSIIKLLQKKMQFLELKKKKKKGTGGTGDGLLKLPQSILLAACCPL